MNEEALREANVTRLFLKYPFLITTKYIKLILNRLEVK